MSCSVPVEAFDSFKKSSDRREVRQARKTMRFRFKEKSRLEYLEIEKRIDYLYNAVDTLRIFDPKFDLNYSRG